MIGASSDIRRATAARGMGEGCLGKPDQDFSAVAGSRPYSTIDCQDPLLHKKGRIRVAKKTKKAIKRLKRAVEELQQQNEALSEELAEALEEQAEEIRGVKAALESRQNGADEQPGEEEPEATEPAERRAEELGVDLSKVKGTGSEGRILVADVEETAGSDE